MAAMGRSMRSIAAKLGISVGTPIELIDAPSEDWQTGKWGDSWAPKFVRTPPY